MGPSPRLPPGQNACHVQNAWVSWVNKQAAAWTAAPAAPHSLSVGPGTAPQQSFHTRPRLLLSLFSRWEECVDVTDLLVWLRRSGTRSQRTVLSRQKAARVFMYVKVTRWCRCVSFLKGEREGGRKYLKVGLPATVVLPCSMCTGHLPGGLDVQKHVGQ